MTPKLIQDLREALQDSAGKPVEIEDAQTHEIYILMTRREFQRLVYDDSDLTEEEMRAAANGALDDPDGWGARGMDSYDRDRPDAPAS
jgi:hypothetical protein